MWYHIAMKKKWLLTSMILMLLILPGLDQRMKVVRYSLSDERIENNIRIVLVSDLHSCAYGKNQKTLVDAIKREEPDVIALCGDIFDHEIPDEGADIFLAGIQGICPVFYVTGNHEYWTDPTDFYKKMDILAKYGIRRLKGETVELQVHETKLYFSGIDDPDARWIERETSFSGQLEAVKGNDGYTILLSHRPERFQAYCDSGFDLVLCGHAHGGQWRIPFLLNGVFAPHQGFFPEYAGGKYQLGNTTMIVSRGLARETTRVPRFYNRPELVVIDLCKSSFH